MKNYSIYWNLSNKIRWNISILLGKIARFIIYLQPKCSCGCDRNKQLSKWIVLGFDVKSTSEMSITFKDGTNVLDMLPRPGFPKTYPKL